MDSKDLAGGRPGNGYGEYGSSAGGGGGGGGGGGVGGHTEGVICHLFHLIRQKPIPLALALLS